MITKFEISEQKAQLKITKLVNMGEMRKTGIWIQDAYGKVNQPGSAIYTEYAFMFGAPPGGDP